MLSASARWLITLGLAAPCLWDYDTLAQERARFPTTLELVTGHFPRHSREFYEWRVADRGRSLEAGALSAELLDDLAVAHSKLGDDARAVELMGLKEERFPGLYTTAANLGTFHVHAGDLEEGLRHIERAIEINPEAHFGREIYQALLVRYLLNLRGEEEALSPPLDRSGARPVGKRQSGFWVFLREAREVSEEGEAEEIRRAVQGVLGMMRFGNHDSPVLLEALADLLLADPDQDAKRLAARALLKAAYEVEEDSARRAYRAKAEAALAMQTPAPQQYENIGLARVEEAFQQELAEADAWWAELRASELRWIETGEDVDARFQEAYLGATPRTRGDREGRYRAVQRYGGYAVAIVVVIALAYIVALPRSGRAA